MFQRFAPIALILSTLALVGCAGSPVGGSVGQGATFALGATQAPRAFTTSAHHVGGPSVMLRIVPPAGGDRAVQSLQHRWVPSDITNFVLTLQTGVTDASGNTTFPTTAEDPSVSAPAAQAGQPLAGFTDLAPNSRYRVTMVVMGRRSADAEPEAINTQHPITIPFNFIEDAHHNIEDSPVALVDVVLDSTVVSGSANIVVGSITPGDFIAPSASPAVASPSPSPEASATLTASDTLIPSTASRY